MLFTSWSRGEPFSVASRNLKKGISMWLPWHAPFTASENASHGEVEAANKYFSIFFPESELSKKVSNKSEISWDGSKKGPCFLLPEA